MTSNSRPAGAPRLYGYKWQKSSKAFLASHPLCQCPYCGEGKIRVVAAEVVDHDPPHRGDPAAFWDSSTWRALSKRCHDSYKQRLEKSGAIIGADVNGIPINPGHHWHR